MSQKEVYLIDATAFCYRAFYALRNLSTSFGQPTNAIYGFVSMLNKVLKENKPEYLAVCFDVSRDTFRAKKFAEYKIQRPPMPEGLGSQLPFIKKIVSAYGIALLEKEGFEADDIIATVNKAAKDLGFFTTIISSDKDMLQLVDKDTAVFSPYKDTGTLYDEKKVIERFGVAPNQITDIIALMGDTADNIPGVKGVGEKTAAELVKEFNSAANLLKNLDKVKKEKLRLLLEQSVDNIKLSKDLAILDSSVDIGFEIGKIKIKDPDNAELFKLFKHLEFKTLLKSLPSNDIEVCAKARKTAQDAELPGLLGKSEELIFWLSEEGGIYFLVKGEFYELEKIGPQAKKILEDNKIKKIGFDLKKSTVALAQSGVNLSNLYFDVKIAAYLVNPSAGSFELADLAWNHLEIRISEKASYGENLQVITGLKSKLEEELEGKDLAKLFYELEMPLSSVLAEMEIKGIAIDVDFLKNLSVETEKKLEKIIKAVYELSGSEFNINSPKQLREILFDKLKLPIVKRTKTGASTDEEVLRKLSKDYELPRILLDYRQLTKLKTTYIDVLPELADKNSRIHTSFNQTTTETGRLSSTNPNLQNIPIKSEEGGKIRKSIISGKKGSFLLSCDYSQIELRILAHISHDKTLIDAFKADKDIHRITASLVCAVEEAEVDDLMRERAKRINFGIVYGLSSFGLARDLNIGFDQAQQFIDAYFARYPGVKNYIDEIIKEARDKGFVTTILGRRRYLPEINNKNQSIRQVAERQAMNTPIQGSASDLIKLAMIDIHRIIEERNLATQMLVQIHDELVFDVPQDELKEACVLIKDRMENVQKLDVPIRVSMKKGKNWLEMEELI